MFDKFNHTPGPWIAEPFRTPREDEDPFAVFVLANIRPRMESVYESADPDTEEGVNAMDAICRENDANAKLISAAPDLLRVVQEFISLYEDEQVCNTEITADLYARMRNTERDALWGKSQ